MSDSDRGSVTTELVLITPVLLALFAFVVLAGRVGEVRGAVVHATQQAARSASLRGDPTSARAAAETTASGNLERLGVSCVGFDLAVDTARFRRGGHVTVTVTCTVDLSDVATFGLPATRTFTGQATEVIDRWRAGQ